MSIFVFGLKKFQMLGILALVLLRLSSTLAIKQPQLPLREIDGRFVGTIFLGSKNQKFDVTFTTDSPVLWVPSDECGCGLECSIGKFTMMKFF